MTAKLRDSNDVETAISVKNGQEFPAPGIVGTQVAI